MDYKDFIDMVCENIQDYLPEKFADAKVQVHQVIKNNDSVLDGLSIQTQETNLSPTIYLNPYYEQLEAGTDAEDILSQIAQVYQEHYVDRSFDTSALTNYEMVKNKIVCKLINEEANRSFLQDKPYKTVEDLAVVYQVLLSKGEEGNGTINITNDLLEQYGVTAEELHNQAIENMETLQPHDFRSMNDIMKEMFMQDIMANENVDEVTASQLAESRLQGIPDTMFVLTNKDKINGAVHILNDKVRENITWLVGEFYALPSSIHEMLIIPKNAGMDVKELEAMVQEVNQTQVAPEERLSDHVYEYDAKEHELVRSDHAAERRQQKMKAESRQEKPSIMQKLKEKTNEALQTSFPKDLSTNSKKVEAVL